MLDIEFGKRFEMLMNTAKMSNAEITEKAKLSKNNVGNYKKGQIPNAQMLYRLSQLFGVSMEYLLTGKESGELTADEQKLIDLYRSTNAQGKGSIINNAEYCAKTMPMEQQLLTSKLG